MDRLRPRLFNIDYWPLRAIGASLEEFLSIYGNRLRGTTAVDFGASKAPYEPRLAEAGIKLLLADIGDVPTGTLKISDDGRVPLDDNSVDLVLSTQVLEHVPNVTGYLAEALRIVKPGGLFFLSTHGTWHLHRYPHDMRRWTTDGLKYDVEQAGFQVESSKPYIGRLATCTYQRMAAYSEAIRPIRLLNPLRAAINAVGNLRMGVEEFFTTQAGREALQQIVVVTAIKPERRGDARGAE